MPKEYKMQMTLSAALGQQFGATFQKAQSALQGSGSEIKKLNALQRDIAGYQAQQRAAADTERKLADLKTQYDNIQREMQETGSYSSALDNKLVDKQRQIDKTADSLDRQNSKLRDMGEDLRAAGVDTDNLTDESKRLESEIEELSEEEEEFGENGANAFEMIGDALIAAGIAAALNEIAEAYKECVSLAAEFDETMSTVEALSGATADEMTALSAEAKALGATTKFTATESAEAMTYMGMAGWDAQQMLSGMDGVLKLAAASGEDLGEVADIVTDNLTAFGMKASDTARFSDVLAVAATNSNTSVSVMGETFKRSAPVAGALGYSIEDVAVATGLMANAGIKGSRAGTALSNTFTGLLEGVTLTGAAIGEVDFSVVNADGTMMSFGSTIDRLRTAFSQMTEAEKVANAQAIAGKQGYAGLLAILNATNDDYNKLSVSIANCTGAAEKMANIRMDNLNGQLTLLNSAADAVKTTIGEAYAKEFQSLSKIATEMLSWINDFLTKHPVLLKSLIAITAEAGALVSIYGAYIAAKKIKNTLTALETKLGIKAIATTTGQTVATHGATEQQKKWNAAILANPWVIALAAVAALTVGIVALVNAMQKEDEEERRLTAASKAEYEQLKTLRREYEETSEAYGENSAQARALGSEIEVLTEKYTENRRTIDDMVEEYDRMHQSISDTLNDNREAYKEIDTEAGAVTVLSDRLARLAAENDKTAATHAEMEAIIERLNESVPGLALNYSDVANGVGDWRNAIETLVTVQANAKRMEAAQTGAVDARIKMAEAETARTQALTDQEAAYKRLQNAQKAYTATTSGAGFAGMLQAAINGTKRELKEAQEEYDAASKAVNDLSEDYVAAERDLEMYTQTLGETYEALYGTNEAEQALTHALEETYSRVQELSAAYTEAYTAAYDSVSGQYDIWDAAATVSAVSTAKITSALESQNRYWTDYNANLEKLRERSADIEGLSDVIASFADGSADSVNAIAGMADASDEDLSAMVENYKKLQETQKTTAESIADMKTDYTAQMAELTEDLKDQISELEMTDEAYSLGMQSVQGYIDGAASMTASVQAAYAAIGDAAIAAMRQKLDMHSPSRVFASLADMTWQGYINETQRIRPQVAAVMGDTADAGVRAVTATPTIADGGINAPVSLSIHIAGSASPETASALQAAGNDIVSRVIEALEDREHDRMRRAYV